MTVALFAGSNADWSIIRPIERLRRQRQGKRTIVIAGGRLTEDHGLPPDSVYRVDDLPMGDTDLAVGLSAGQTVAQTVAILQRHHVRRLVIAGDRTEALAAATAAACTRVPILHIHGGETTLGAIDERIRHALTQLADRHCVAHPSYRDRLVGWGIPETSILVSGAPALDALLAGEYATADELPGYDPTKPLILVSHHPVTGQSDTDASCEAFTLIEALRPYRHAAQIIACAPNRDAGYTSTSAALGAAGWQTRERYGTRLWWGLMARAQCLVGNSSSGFIEAPCFDLPVINVGGRQRGRLNLGNVVNVPAQSAAIAMAVQPHLAALAQPRIPRHTALTDGFAARRIADLLEQL